MATRYVLGIVDYMVITISLLISAAIGIKFRFSGGKQRTTNEYLLAGQDMHQFPVILSITATALSAITMIGIPSEVYKYGVQIWINVFGYFIGMHIASYLFVPVYFQCGVTTTYEFLEMRFGKYTKYTVSILFVVQTVAVMSAVLYGPAIALSAVTNLSLDISIWIIGLVCTFYCVLGGLKAVLWTDTIQAFFMLTCIIAFYAAGIGDGGGFKTIFKRANDGGRLKIFKFGMDLVTRYTFWNCLIRGVIYGVGMYGTCQLEVQRLLSVKQKKKAIQTLQISTIPMFIMHSLCILMGLVQYSIFYLCDPVLDNSNTGLTKYDQIIPYYLVSRFSIIPGLTGLCISGIFCGSLSTISSAVNSLSTVTVNDFIQPFFTNFGEKKTVFLAKVLSLLYGLLCIGMTFLFSNAQSIKQLGTTLWNILDGPITAIFLVGVLTRKASDKCALIGLLLGFSFTSWMGYGSLFSGYAELPLSLSTSNCSPNGNTNTSLKALDQCYGHNCTAPFSRADLSDTFILYKISFQWFPVIGCLVATFFTFLCVLITGWKNNVIDANSKCLSPVSKLWIKPEETVNYKN